jgi:hypothetical protein
MKLSLLGVDAKPVSRFSRTVSSGKISRPCGTMAMPRRARWCCGWPEMSSPFHSIFPELIGC